MKKKGPVDVITVDGILNADTNPKFEEILHPISDEKCPRILLDVSKLTYISSASIGCFIGIIRKIRTKGGDIRFSNMTPKVRRIFQLLDMDDFFLFFSDLDEGIASFDS